MILLLLLIVIIIAFTADDIHEVATRWKPSIRPLSTTKSKLLLYVLVVLLVVALIVVLVLQSKPISPSNKTESCPSNSIILN